MKSFEEIEIIDEGAFGTVMRCRNKETGDIVAIKKMKQRFASFNECLQLKEVKSLRKIKHENVMKLLQVFRENDHLYLVFELLKGSLLKTIQLHHEPFPESEVKRIIYQLIEGLQAVHKNGFFHRDIKPENLMWLEDTLKIGDFGLAKEIRSRPPYTEYIGSRWYRAPEILLRHEFYNSPVDLWAVGAIMFELFTLKPPFQGTSETDQMMKIFSIVGTPSSTNWPDGVRLLTKLNIRVPLQMPASLSGLVPNVSSHAIDLITKLLSLDPAKRVNASQALVHPFFQGESQIVNSFPNFNQKEIKSEISNENENDKIRFNYSNQKPVNEENHIQSNLNIYAEPDFDDIFEDL